MMAMVILTNTMCGGVMWVKGSESFFWLWPARNRSWPKFEIGATKMEQKQSLDPPIDEVLVIFGDVWLIAPLRTSNSVFEFFVWTPPNARFQGKVLS